MESLHTQRTLPEYVRVASVGSTEKVPVDAPVLTPLIFQLMSVDHAKCELNSSHWVWVGWDTKIHHSVQEASMQFVVPVGVGYFQRAVGSVGGSIISYVITLFDVVRWASKRLRFLHIVKEARPVPARISERFDSCI